MSQAFTSSESEPFLLHTHHHSLYLLHLKTKNTTTMSVRQSKRIQQRRSTGMLAATSLLFVLSLLITTQVNAFSLSMVATGTTFGTSRGLNIPSAAPTGVTSTLISQLAQAALKRRLQAQTRVACDVTANSSSLFKGKVGPVTVKGKGWQSPLGLTCRALEATVETCELDMARVLSSQKLVLTTPGKHLLWHTAVC